MQRIVWLGYLFGMLLLLLAAQRVALATYSAEDTSSGQYAAFRNKLSENNVSEKVIKYSNEIYTLMSVTQLVTSYPSINEMMAALESSWDKQKLSYLDLSNDQLAIANEVLRKTPVTGEYKISKPIQAPKLSPAPYHLLIFVSSHPESMSAHLASRREWIKNKVGKKPFISNILLVSSHSKSYSRQEINNFRMDPALIRYLNNKFQGHEYLSQEQLAREMLWYYFEGWNIFKTVDLSLYSGLRTEFENALSDQRDFTSFTDITLVTPQPFCELTRAIVSRRLPAGSFKLHHSCHDNKMPPASLNIDDIADRLDAFKDWINTVNEYHQDIQH